MVGVIGGKRLGEDRRSTIKQGISMGKGPAKDDLNQRAEIEVFISFLGYQTELWGVLLAEIKNQKNVNSALPAT
jgi:hypothetical protein